MTNGKFKQDRVINQFTRDIYLANTRNWKTALEKDIERTKNADEKQSKSKNKPAPYISYHDPNNPLNGSSRWTREQWAAYNEKQKQLKSINKK